MQTWNSSACSLYKYSMWQKTNVRTLRVCLQQSSSKVTWNYTWNLTLGGWIHITHQIMKRHSMHRIKDHIIFKLSNCCSLWSKTKKRVKALRRKTYNIVEIYLVCWWMSARMEHYANELISINLVGVRAIALTKKKHDKINLAWLLLQLSERVVLIHLANQHQDRN